MQIARSGHSTGGQRRLKRWVLFGSVLGLCTVLLILPLITSTSPPQVPNGGSGAVIKAEKSMYGVNQTPRFRFEMKAIKTSVLQSWLQPGKAVAAVTTTPKVSLSYDDKLVAMPNEAKRLSEGSYEVTLRPSEQPKPGKYQLKVAVETKQGEVSASQTFAWGVLAMNFDRAVYIPGEVAHMQFGVLDSTGHTLCDAPISVSVQAPDGTNTLVNVEKSGDCKGDTYVATPDYTAQYTVGQTGTYKVTVTLDKSSYSMSDTFMVKSSRQYDIVRHGPTRLFPPSPYNMVLNITPSQDFTGPVSDSLPLGFTVTDPHGGTVQTGSSQQTITWQVAWKAGQNHVLEYAFQAPPKSPAFYFTGDLQIGSGSSAVREGRSWQMAGDATISIVNSTSIGPITSDANGDITGSVTTTAGNTLILIFGENVSNSSGAIVSVSDSASNSWTYSTNATNANPPAAFVLGTTTVNSIAYVTNASAITSVTVRAKPAVPMSFWVLEASGINTSSPVIDSNWVANATTSLSHSSSAITLPLCDAPTTDMMLRGGDYFCADDSALIVTSMMAGAQTSSGITLTTSGFTQLGTLCVAASCSGTIVRMGSGYKITSVSATVTSDWTNTTSRPAALCIIAFRPAQTGSLERRHFWAS